MVLCTNIEELIIKVNIPSLSTFQNVTILYRGIRRFHSAQ